MRPLPISLLVLCLSGVIANAHAQSYTHVAPHTVGGTAALTGATLRTYVSVGLTAAGTVENASQTRIMAFGPWPIYALRRRSDTGSPVESLDVPASFSLHQNYPNPFNPVTTIRYAVPEPVHVRLTVYDAVGRAVAVLVDERQPPGTYTMPFDATGLSSGLYLYRLEAGRYHAARTMLVLK